MENIADIYKLTPVQAGLLFHSLSAPQGAVYVEQFARRVSRLDVVLWQAAWDRVADRHPILRTGFHWEGLEKPVQVVRQQVQLQVAVTDLTGQDPAGQEAQLARLARDDRQAPLDLRQAPPMRQRVVHLSPSESYFVWTYHHLLLDGWSAFRVIDEVLDTYHALEAGRDHQPPPVPAFKDYLRWLNRQDQAGAEAFWRDYLGDFTAPTALGLPQGGRPDGQYLTLRHCLGEDLSRRLRDFARRSRLTLNTLFQGSWAYLLGVYSGEDEVVFGATVAGRPPELPGSEAMVGLFINTLPVRVRLDPTAAVARWLEQLQDQQVRLRQYDYSSLVDVQGWSGVPRHQSLFHSMLAVESFPASRYSELPQVTVVQETNYPLTLVVEPTGTVTLKAMFDSRRYHPRDITALLERWQTVLARLPEMADRPLGDLGLLPAHEARRLEDWNATATPYPLDEGLAAMFARQVRATPELTAVVAGDQRLSYRELDEQSSRLARLLRERGLRAGEPVVLLLEPSVELITALVAVVRAGGAYAPLDPQMPRQRLTGMLEGLQKIGQPPRVMISHRGRGDSLGMQVLDLDRAAVQLAACPVETPDWPVDTRQLLYVMHTSGSTGRPKAAGVFHHSFVNFIRFWNEAFAFDTGDRVLLVNKVSFDLSQKNIWGALLTGGQLHLALETRFDPLAARSLIAAQGITWMNCTPSMAYAILEAGDDDFTDLATLRYLFLGGEPVDKARLAPWLLSPACRGELVNTYGPTECTDLCGVHRFTPDEFRDLARPVTVGKALPNVQTYVLDRHLNRLPPGVCGEVMIGGVSLGSGYLNNAVMSADRFIPNPFDPRPGARLYRTGDLGYFQEDGTIVVRGRVDFQVKLRGYRVELGEIDTQLRRHPRVQDAVTVVTGQGQQLVSYLAVADGEPGQLRRELRAQLAERLPEVMVPGLYVILPALPLNDNGKVDRSALPPHGPEDRVGGADSVTARDDTEARLAALWGQVLGLETVGVTDNFFELGGHSLSITQVGSRIPKVFGVQVPLSALFEQPTVAGQARLIRQARLAKADTLPAPAAEPRPAVLPLSFAQSRLWFLHRFDPDNLAYNVPNALTLDGPVDVAALDRALTRLVERHESLRTRFPQQDGQPHQVIDPPGPVELRVLDLRQAGSGAREAELSRAATAEVQHRFDLERGPLARYLLVILAPDSALLLLTLHHIVTDGWSGDLLARELDQDYRALREGRTLTLAPPALQYVDYALWQRRVLQGERLAREVDWWRQRLAGSVNTLALPYDHPRPPRKGQQGGLYQRPLSPALTEGVRALGQRQGATPFMVLLAGFAALLHRLSGQEDFNLGTPMANRHHQETEGTVGCFVNTLVLRLRPRGEQPFLELLEAVRTHSQEAFDHQDLPFELLVDELQQARSATLHPFFQVMFSLQSADQDASLIDRDQWVTRFDLQLTVDQRRGLTVNWEYDRELFETATVQRLAGLYETLLAGVVADPHRRLEHIPLLIRQPAAAPSGTGYPRQALVAELFEQQAARRPRAVAVSAPTATLTYGELEARANRLGHWLIRQGVGENTPVGVSLERGPELVVALLGVLKAGGAYVPLDPTYPPQRLEYMAADSNIDLLLTRRALTDRLPGGTVRRVSLDSPTLEAELATLPVNPPRPAGTLSSGERLAYITYTSGTTGQPKGVLITQRGVVRLVSDPDYCTLDPETVMLQCAPVAFDASTFEIWGPLLNGGRLVPYGEGAMDLTLLEELIHREGINTAFLTTALFVAWMGRLRGPTGLSRLLVGGEVIPPRTVEHLYRVDGRVRFSNVYGPTENTTFSSHYPVPRHFDFRRPLPIGRAIAHSRLQVLDGAGQPLPPGVVGELYTGGDGVALGYLNRPELTAARFRPDPFSPEPDGRLYRTGDRVRLTADGDVEFLGRVDEQVKIRGFRIEPGEIQALLERHPRVASALIVALDDGAAGKQLAAYFMARDGSLPTVGELHGFLQQRLPPYMLPDWFVPLAAFPLTDNGKVDRHRLPRPGPEHRLQGGEAPAENELEQRILAIWEEVLEGDGFGVEDDFFQLGGHSLLATRVVARIEEELGVAVPLKQFFAEPTVRALARYVDLAGGTAPERPMAEDEDEDEDEVVGTI